MDLKEVKDLVDFMNENNLLELEIEKEGMRVRLKKSSPQDANPQVTVIPQTNPLSAAGGKEEISARSDSTIEIKSPMVGTFYRAPAPDAQPYAEVGDTVKENQVLCIIEAMKLMNEIKSEARVKIVDILVENGDPVEFGQPIFLAEPVKG